MGATKSDRFSEEQNQIAEFAKALGHPARIAILQSLAERKTCVCGEIVEVVGLAQATVSQHLKAMKATGLIQGRVEGTSTCYCIDPKSFTTFKNKLEALLQRVSTCC